MPFDQRRYLYVLAALTDSSTNAERADEKRSDRNTKIQFHPPISLAASAIADACTIPHCMRQSIPGPAISASISSALRASFAVSTRAPSFVTTRSDEHTSELQSLMRI